MLPNILPQGILKSKWSPKYVLSAALIILIKQKKDSVCEIPNKSEKVIYFGKYHTALWPWETSVFKLLTQYHHPYNQLLHSGRWWWIVFVVWLTDKRHLALLFPDAALFEPVQYLSTGLAEWSCAVVITIS